MRIQVICCLLLHFMPIQALFSQKTLVFEDRIYESGIKTVRLSPNQDYLFPAVTPIEPMNLVLEFDDLQANRNNYYGRLVHCNYDWTKSNLMDLDFLHEYNEYPMNDFAFSGGTQIPYVHYRFPIPQVKVPGNYLLMVYRDGDKSDLIITRRLMVYSSQLNFTRDNPNLSTGSSRLTNQQINFTIDYSHVEILNPLESVHVILRQNQRWDNAKIDVPPTFVRDGDSQLEYHFFDQGQSFNAGNEFRFVDFRSLNFPGQNTGKLNRSVKPFQLSVQTDLPRTDQAYAQFNDYDGNYIVDNQDTGEPETNANYLQVTFSLHPEIPLKDPVYVAGAFNNWNRTEETLMKYDPSRELYEATLFLKQGLYNYQYLVDSPTLPANFFEGSHFETQNVYEILVYNHTFQRNIDVLIGYYVIPVNQH